MKYLPKSLLTRISLIIALLLITTQLVSLKIFDIYEREPRAEALALEISTIVNFTKASMAASATDKRVQLLNELSTMGNVRIYPAHFFEQIEPIPDDPFLQLVIQKVTQRLPLGTLIAINHFSIEGIWVSFELNSELFWVVIPRTIVDRPFPWHWIGWGTIIALIALVAAYMTTERINRRLNRLIEAAESVRKDLSPEKLPHDNLVEFSDLNVAFNEMLANLKKASQERKFLLASVSHDIRTPLTRLRIASEMLPEKSDDLKNSMEEDILEINNILNQFLDFARGFEDEPKIPVNLGKFLNNIQVKHLRMGQKFILRKKNIKTDIPKKLFIDLRPLALQRCLDNLINNAFFYAKGKVVLIATLEEESFTISVVDDGPGIPDKELERLLKPFERLDEARGNEGGCGLGLSIADRIVKAHDGKLELISDKKDKGLEAKITIPIIRA